MAYEYAESFDIKSCKLRTNAAAVFDFGNEIHFSESGNFHAKIKFCYQVDATEKSTDGDGLPIYVKKDTKVEVERAYSFTE